MSSLEREAGMDDGGDEEGAFGMTSMTGERQPPRTGVIKTKNNENSRGSHPNEDPDDMGDDGVPNDVIAVSVRKGTQGVALVSVLIVTSMIAAVTFLRVFEYRYDPSKAGPSNASLQDCTAIDEPLPVWADLLFIEIGLIQNLVHASLVGAATIVAAYRGDIIWMYFARNIGFYLGLTACSYVVVDVHALLLSLNLSEDGQTGAVFDKTNWKTLVRLVPEMIMAIAAVVAFIKLEFVRQRVIALKKKYFESARSFSNALSLEIDNERFPPLLAQTTAQRGRSQLIYKAARGIQGMAVFYTIRTTWIVLMNACTDPTGGNDNDPTGMEPTLLLHGSLASFASSYNAGAHQAGLLSFIFEAATFPRWSACQGAAILAGGWRLWVALAYLPRAIPIALNGETVWPLVFTAAEVVLMSLVVISAVLQYRENLSTADGTNSGGFISGATNPAVRTVAGNHGAYKQVASDTFEDEHGVADDDNYGTDSETLEHSETTNPNDELANDECDPPCWTMRQIAASTRYSRQQRRGAHLMWIGSLALLLEMTLECMLLLRLGSIGTKYTNGMYKWGMHVCAMYLFCCIMVASCQEVYGRARILLFLACPAGTVIGLWQLWMMLTTEGQSVSSRTDSVSVLVAALFGIRGICGILQTAGLVLLRHIEPEGSDVDETVGDPMDENNNLGSDYDTTHVDALVSRGRFLLLHVYLPILAGYIAQVAYMGTCNYPLVSPNTQNDCAAAEGSDTAGTAMGTYVMEPTWPGFGVFWHYGFLLIAFAGDGLATRSCSYKPSLAIATLFAAHVSLLILVSVLMETGQMVAASIRDIGTTTTTTTTTTTSAITILQLCNASAFMLAAGILAWRLHAVGKEAWK